MRRPALVFAVWVMFCAALVPFVFGVSLSVFAQSITPTPQPVSADRVNAVSRNLYCPVCTNTPLEVCPTTACASWREQVRTLLASGQTEDQVRQYFIDHFGMRTVGTPVDPLTQVLTIVLPLSLIVLIGTLLAWQALRRRATLAADSMTPIVPITDAPNDHGSEADRYRARLESELEEP